MYKNKKFLATSLILTALLTIGILAFLGVPYVEAADSAQAAVTPPGVATLVSPSGSITDTTPTYKWKKVSASTWYYLWVNGPAGKVFTQWYQSSAVCGASTCSATPGFTLAGGNHQWWIQTWNSDGYGPWSSAKNFSLPASGFNSQFNSSSTGWQAHAGSWSIAGGQWYTAPGLPNSLYASTSYNGTFSTLDYRARLWRQGSSQNCLVIRGSPTPLDIYNDWDSGYRFCYSQGGYYSVQKRTPDTYWTYLQPYTVSSSIPGGDRWNEVRIIANGSSLYFYINGVLIWSGVDSTLVSGRVGITISDVSTGGNPLWVDWATLSNVISSQITDTISPEQQALNQAALEGTPDMQVLPADNP